MSSYAQPDTFGASSGLPIAVDPSSNLTYVLGFDDSTSPPSPVWELVSSWGRAKQRFGATWAAAKAQAPTWGIAKALTGS